MAFSRHINPENRVLFFPATPHDAHLRLFCSLSSLWGLSVSSSPCVVVDFYGDFLLVFCFFLCCGFSSGRKSDIPFFNFFFEGGGLHFCFLYTNNNLQGLVFLYFLFSFWSAFFQHTEKWLGYQYFLTLVFFFYLKMWMPRSQ